MKRIYRDAEIKVTREKSISGESMLFYSVMYHDGFEIASGFSEGEDLVNDYLESLKCIVDDFHEHPEDYEYEAIKDINRIVDNLNEMELLLDKHKIEYNK